MKAIVIVSLFLAYVLFMILLFMYTDPSDAVSERIPAVEDSFLVDTDIYPDQELRRLWDDFYAAYNNQDYERARDIANEVIDRYPNSPDADEMAILLKNIDGQLLQARQVSTASSTPAPRRRSAPTRRSTPVSPPASVSTPAPAGLQVIEIDPGAAVTSDEINKLLSKLRQVDDEQPQMVWYYNKNVSHYIYKSSVEVYFGSSTGKELWPRLRIYYNGDNELDLTAYEFYADDKEYRIAVRRGNLQRGTGLKGAWAWYDTQMTNNEYKIIKAVMQSKRAAIRYYGRNGVVERAIGELEKLRMKHVIDVFEALYRDGGRISTTTMYPR